MAKPTLEGLPTELKVLILYQVPDSDTLKSLVHASPRYHQAYVAVRHETLQCLVKRQYTGFLDLAEALTAVRSVGAHFATQRENAISLLDEWRRRDEIREISQSSLNRYSPNRLDEPDGIEESIKLLHFHKMLCFFLDDYSINAPSPPWIQRDQWENKYLPLHLSLQEKHRFLRAMCRLQSVKNIFGDSVYCFGRLRCDRCSDTLPCESCGLNGSLLDWEEGPATSNRCCYQMKGWKLGQVDELTDEFRTWDVSKIAYRLFYGAMPLWEHEEMGGVFYYLISKIKTMIEEIKIDLRQLSKSHPGELFWDILPKEERVPFSEIEMESDIAHFEINHSRELAGLGPEFLYRALHMDRLSRRNGICLNTRPYSEGMFIGCEVELQWDDEFPFTEPADRYETQNFEHFWSTLPPLEQPTVGWQKAWILHHSKEDSFEDALNYNRETEKDWEWGYALWDEKRLKEWKAPLLVPRLGNDEVAAVSESTSA